MQTSPNPHSSPLSAPSASNATKPIPPRRLINEGIKNSSTQEISFALQLDRSLLPYALRTAVSKGIVPLVRYLLDTEGAPVETVNVSNVVTEPSIELLDVLVAAGWNLNQRSPLGFRLLDMIPGNEEMVRWCLHNRAEVSDGREDEDDVRYPPLTEEAAGLATVSCFKLLRANNAQLGRKVLHKAASSAASCDELEKPERIAMLEYLVEKEQLDVNKLDTDGQLPNHWGTPLAYAAKERHGADVVRWLLEKGADPKIKECFGHHDALSYAELYGNEEVAQVLRQSIIDEGNK